MPRASAVLVQLVLLLLGHTTHSASTSSPVYGRYTCRGDGNNGSAGGTARRHLSIADLHGDWKHSLEILEALGVVAEGVGDNYNFNLTSMTPTSSTPSLPPMLWSGGDAVLVQTGDVVNRGDYGGKLYTLLFRLQEEAASVGGEVHLLIGNHELMSMQGDQRYTSQRELAAFGGAGMHLTAWSRAGFIGSRMRERAEAVLVVEDVAYVHGGVLPTVLEAYASTSTSTAGGGGGGGSGPATIAELNRVVMGVLLQNDADGLQWDTNAAISDIVHPLGPNGLMWSRELVLDDEASACAALENALAALGAARMVVGHCPQVTGDVLPRCGGRILAADTFLSAAYTEDPAASSHNEAALEFFGSDSAQTMAAIYPQRDPICVPMMQAANGGAGSDGDGGGGGEKESRNGGTTAENPVSSASLPHSPLFQWRHILAAAAFSWVFICFFIYNF